MFQPEVAVFDCNAALGRHHNQRVAHASREDLLKVMSEAGISQTLVYNPYGIHFGAMEGNRFLLEEIQGNKSLIPQFVISFATEEIEQVRAEIRNASVRSLRVFPNSHNYPFVHWIADSWLEWMAQEKMALWIPMGRRLEVDMRDLYETARRHPKVPIVLAGTHYSNYSVVWPLLKALEHIYLDLSRFDLMNGVERLISQIGVGRLLFGSDFPDVDPEPYLFYLHRCGLKPSELQAICQDNLKRLLRREA